METSQIIATERAFWMEGAEEDFIAAFVAQREDAAATVAAIIKKARQDLFCLPSCPLLEDTLEALIGLGIDAEVTPDRRAEWHDEAVDAWNDGQREVDTGTRLTFAKPPAQKGPGVWVAAPFWECEG